MQRATFVNEFNSENLADFNIQDQLLPGVSRTFAFTIPQLPANLSSVVTNAYLLCRIADTIEDDAKLTPEIKAQFEYQFVQVVSGEADPQMLSTALLAALSDTTPQTERNLIKEIPTIIRCLESFNRRQQRCLQRCVRIMCQGMSKFQRNASIEGLTNLAEFNQYCYYVAGVVGELLTELFCDYSPNIEQYYTQLMPLALSFGQGLQMTNILKDLWEDHQRGACWLPRDIFQNHGIELTKLNKQHHLVGFELGLDELIGIATGHIENALRYTLLLPTYEDGLRRFCLWALGLAILTLRKLHRNPKFSNGTQVKVSRRTVKSTILATNICAKNNYMLKYLFKVAALGLPITPQPTISLFTEWFDHE